jgi:hypothetical protein
LLRGLRRGGRIGKSRAATIRPALGGVPAFSARSLRPVCGLSVSDGRQLKTTRRKKTSRLPRRPLAAVESGNAYGYLSWRPTGNAKVDGEYRSMDG